MAKGVLYAVDVAFAENHAIWIGFRLPADSVNVVIIITTLGGSTVRTISMGNLKQGRYVDRSTSCFWNRRNESSEVVAAGQYRAHLLIDGVSQATTKFELPAYV